MAKRKKKKIKQTSSLKRKNLLFFSIIAVICLIIFVIYFLRFSDQKNARNTATPIYTPNSLNRNNLSPNPTFTPLPSPPGFVEFDSNRGWKIFTDTQFNYQIKFPARGLGLTKLNNTCEGNLDKCSMEIDCGNNISDRNYLSKDELSDVWIDEFFHITIWKIDQDITLKEYINNATKDYVQGNLFMLAPINNSGADEAYAINHKPGQLGNGDSTPFSFGLAIYKKGDKLYEIGQGQQIGDASCYAPVKGVNWDIPNSFRLN